MGVLTGLLFFSQSAYFSQKAQDFGAPVLKKGTGYAGSQYIGKANEWLENNVYDKISALGGEVEGQKAALGDKIVEQKEKVEKASIDGAKKILAEKVLGILGVTPQDLGVSCPAD